MDRIKQLLRVLVIFLVLVLLPGTSFVISLKVNKFQGNKKGVVFIEDYIIKIHPAYYADGGYPSDSCRMIICDVKDPLVTDTLVYYPGAVGIPLYLILGCNHKWVLAKGSANCTSHFLDVEYNHGEMVSIDENVHSVLCLEEKRNYFRLSYAQVKEEPPYYLNTVYTSRRVKNDPSLKTVASSDITGHTITWQQSYLYNYALISDGQGNVTDTLRWKRSGDDDSWEFVMVVDTLVIDDHRPEYPSCLSPWVVRDFLSLTRQYPKGYLTNEMFVEDETLFPVIHIKFQDSASHYDDPKIVVSSINLSQSPLIGTKVDDSFLREKIFIMKE